MVVQFVCMLLVVVAWIACSVSSCCRRAVAALILFRNMMISICFCAFRLCRFGCFLCLQVRFPRAVCHTTLAQMLNNVLPPRGLHLRLAASM